MTSCFYDYNSFFGRLTRNTGELPTDIDQFDGFVIPGSKYNATDDEPWIEPLCEVIRQAHAQGKALFGICFGHQVIAKALGGS